MSRSKVSRQDLEELADKLSGLEGRLSEPEKALLSGVLETAARAAEAGGGSVLVRQVDASSGAQVEVDVEGDLPSLRDGFVSAFTPGNRVSTGGAASPQEIQTGITIGIRF